MNHKYATVSKWLLMAAVLALLQVATVSTSYAAPPAGGRDGGGGGDCGTYHKVQYGETLFSIGRRYGVHPYRIAEANGLHDPGWINAGQVLYIPCSDGYHPPKHPDGGQCCKPGYGHKPYPQFGFGYDFTGYYYETYYPNYRRYSYTCGYHYNCY